MQRSLIRTDPFPICRALGLTLLSGLAGCGEPTRAPRAPQQNDRESPEQAASASPEAANPEAIPAGSPGPQSSPADEEATFLGASDRRRVAVVDFETNGAINLTDAARIAAEGVRSKLSPRWFVLIERSQLRRILQEQDLAQAGPLTPEARQTIGRLAGVSHLVLGSVSQVAAVTLDARLVEVASGRIDRQAAVTVDTLEALDAACEQAAAILSASDEQYARIEEERAAQRVPALAEAPQIERVENALRIRFHLPAQGKNELMLVRQAREKLRDLYVDYCRQHLGASASKAELVDYCRRHEEFEEVRSVGTMKEYVARVPLPES